MADVVAKLALAYIRMAPVNNIWYAWRGGHIWGQHRLQALRAGPLPYTLSVLMNSRFQSPKIKKDSIFLSLKNGKH